MQKTKDQNANQLGHKLIAGELLLDCNIRPKLGADFHVRKKYETSDIIQTILAPEAAPLKTPLVLLTLCAFLPALLPDKITNQFLAKF